MYTNLLWLGLILLVLQTAACANLQTPPPVEQATAAEQQENPLFLPPPAHDSQTSIEEAMKARRSVRTYSQDALSLAEVSQMLWAAQGVTHPKGFRTVPSAGALYPLDIYLVVGNVTDLPPGIYHFQPQSHSLVLVSPGDVRQDLYKAALEQSSVKDAPIVLVISAVYARTTGRYGERGIQYVHMEVGHAAQNIYLQAESLALGTVIIGAFHDEQVKTILHLGEEEVPLGLMPIGRR